MQHVCNVMDVNEQNIEVMVSGGGGGLQWGGGSKGGGGARREEDAKEGQLEEK